MHHLWWVLGPTRHCAKMVLRLLCRKFVLNLKELSNMQQNGGAERSSVVQKCCSVSGLSKDMCKFCVELVAFKKCASIVLGFPPVPTSRIPATPIAPASGLEARSIRGLSCAPYCPGSKGISACTSHTRGVLSTDTCSAHFLCDQQKKQM